jgi:hypothetical protein
MMVLARGTIIEFNTCDGTMLRGWLYPQVEKLACVIIHGLRTPWGSDYGIIGPIWWDERSAGEVHVGR